METLKAAVIGIGAMGQHHARVYAELSETELVAVADTDEAKLDQVTRTWGAATYTDFREMMAREMPDVVSVCVPTSLHYEIAEFALKCSHVLVEKPIAATVPEAHWLCIAAAMHHKTLMVGHIERFNRTAQALQELVEGGKLGEVFCISTRRAGPSPRRIRDVGVAVDLAVHDIDLMRWLGGEARVIAGHVQRRLHEGLEDAVDGLLALERGAVGVLHADWLTRAKIRDVTVVGRDGTARADLAAQMVEVWFAPGAVQTELVLGAEPLKLEIQAFVRAVLDGAPPPVTGEDGMAALDVALALVEAGEANLQMGG